MSRPLREIWNGEQGPVYRFRLRDGAGVRDMATAAVEFYIEDQDGASYGMRPGVIAGARADGTVDLQLRGRESDWPSTPKDLFVIPKLYYATAPDGTPAVNALLNPSFDTASGTNPTRIATSWSQSGSGGVFDNYANDPAPSVIYGAGTFQLVNNPTGNYLFQNVAATPSIGDIWSFGCWVRGSAISGSQDDFNSIAMSGIGGTQEDIVVRLPVGEFDWRFLRGELVMMQSSHTTMRMSLFAESPHTGSWRFDEAFMFAGRWAVFYADAMRIPVKSRSRIPKASNQLKGIGSFEVDSNADGVSDAWTKLGSGGTFSIEKNPAHVSEGAASQKAVLTDQSEVSLRHVFRGRFRPGDTWRASVMVKTNGALTIGSGTGGFNIVLQTQYFEASPVSSVATNFGTNLATFTEHSTSLAITGAERSELMVDIGLGGVTGTVWIDDVKLERTVEGP